MCCCTTSNVNGTPGYEWPGQSPNVYPVRPPEHHDGDEVLVDLPGRCCRDRMLDSHSFHLQMVKNRRETFLLCRHGRGTERYPLGRYSSLIDTLRAAFQDQDLYFALLDIYNALRKAKDDAADDEHRRWASAALEKRIKVRKRNGVRWVDIV